MPFSYGAPKNPIKTLILRVFFMGWDFGGIPPIESKSDRGRQQAGPGHSGTDAAIHCAHLTIKLLGVLPDLSKRPEAD
jgi:hypothetical protein